MSRPGYTSGAAVCPAGIGSADASALLPVPAAGRSLLAPVTMVFVAVDGGKALVNSQPDTAHCVDGAISRIMEVSHTLIAVVDVCVG